MPECAEQPRHARQRTGRPTRSTRPPEPVLLDLSGAGAVSDPEEDVVDEPAGGSEAAVTGSRIARQPAGTSPGHATGSGPDLSSISQAWSRLCQAIRWAA